MRTRRDFEREIHRALKEKHGGEITAIHAWEHGFPEPKQKEVMGLLDKLPGPARWEQILCLITEASLREFGSSSIAASYLGVSHHTIIDRSRRDKNGRWKAKA